MATADLLLRLARPDDAMRLFEWRNDPWIVERSTSQKEVLWSEHAAWFERSLATPEERLIFIIESKSAGQAVGLVRFDRTGRNDAVISVYLLQAFTGRGWGPQAIRQGCATAFSTWNNLRRMIAHVRADNRPGQSAFAKAGFVASTEKSLATPAGHVTFCLDMANPGKISTRDDDRHNVDFYTALVERTGIDPRSLNWGSRASQELRFRALASMADLTETDTLLDVGCGLGDFYDWLRTRNAFRSYRGIDLTPKMIEMARARFPGVPFEIANILEMEVEPADFVFASGIFYLRSQEPIEYMNRMLSRLFEICRKAVIVNSLSMWADRREAGEFFADPARTLDFCHSLTRWVSLRHDYHPADFTIALYRNSGSR
jgi:RimJ/RimL family protein N-acetyltransferase/SAM-dependent methyltransferase